MKDALIYDMGKEVEAFSTRITTPLDFEVVLPLHQAHSTNVVRVPADDNAITGVDALITNVKGLRIGIKTADCVPVLLYDFEHGAVGAVHSGWKGTLGNIVGNALCAMSAEYGTRGQNVRAVIGPCIHVEAFEVGDELYGLFAEAGYEGFCVRMQDIDTHQRIKWHIDLLGICCSQLRDAGVDCIEQRAECTYQHYQEFYSARRLKENFGQQRILNCIMLKH